MSFPSFAGVHTALVTPFRNGKVDRADLEALVEFQVTSGIDGLVPVGTTGESPTLDHEEHVAVIAAVVKAVAGRRPVIAGTGSNATAEAIDLTRRADAVGADAFLQVAPYYNKPTPEGLFRHFSAIAACTAKPIILYSIPSRCGIDIPVEVVARLAERHPNVVAIKESGGSCDRVDRLRETLGDRITVLSGDDALTVPFMALGARGVVSVASNFDPAGVREMVHLALAGDFAGALRRHEAFRALFRVLFIEANPGPVKHALWRAGRIASPEVRAPLAPLSSRSEEMVETVLRSLAHA